MSSQPLASLPSVDRVLQHDAVAPLVAQHGRAAVTGAIRSVLAELRAARTPELGAPGAILERVAERLEGAAQPSLRPVFNLTGTVLHTNLGRAQLPAEAIEAMSIAARHPVNLEYDLATGKRGERDEHVEALLCRLTGAQAATVVNNNAAALLLVLGTLAARREVPVSRGELIEIGGSFRLPELMARSGCRLREVGTTNRTHLADYAEAVGPKTGRRAEGPHEQLRDRRLHRGGAGGRPRRPVPRARPAVRGGPGQRHARRPAPLRLAVRAHGAGSRSRTAPTSSRSAATSCSAARRPASSSGAPTCWRGFARNPLRRALRVDKLTLAALGAVLRLYLDPDRLAERVPALRLLARPADEIRALAERLRPRVAAALAGRATVEVIACESQIGSGALPTQRIASAGLAVRPGSDRIAAAFRRLPVPVIGRVHQGAFILDLRCLEDEDGFAAQLERL